LLLLHSNVSGCAIPCALIFTDAWRSLSAATAIIEYFIWFYTFSGEPLFTPLITTASSFSNRCWRLLSNERLSGDEVLQSNSKWESTPNKFVFIFGKKEER
jgi:hypothetical protein